MWRGLTSIATLLPVLTEIRDLLQEQNALHRELLTAMGTPSRVPPTSPATALPRPAPRKRQFTDKDVVQVTRDMMQEQAMEAWRAQRPHAETVMAALRQFPGEPPAPEPFFDQLPQPISPPPSSTAPNTSSTASATVDPAAATSSRSSTSRGNGFS